MKCYKSDNNVSKELRERIFDDSVALTLSSEYLQKLSTDKITVIAAYLGNIELAAIYGNLIGYAVLKEPIVYEGEDFYNKGEQIHIKTNMISFSYCVNAPYLEPENMRTVSPVYDYPIVETAQKLPLKEFEKYMKEQERVESQLKEFCPWGLLGFDENNRTEELSGNDLTCRLFIENVKKISLEEDFAGLVQGRIQNLSR